MRIALLSANPPTANRYIGLLLNGLAEAGVELTLYTRPGPTGSPVEAAQADLIHLHWLELWHRPPYLGLQGLAGLRKPGRGLRRLLVPALNGPRAFAWRRRRCLASFLKDLAGYKARGGRIVYTVHNLAQHEGEASLVEEAGLRQLLGLVDGVHVHSRHVADELLKLAASPGRFRVVPGPSLLAGEGDPPDGGGKSSRTPIVLIPHGNYVGAYPDLVDRAAARRRLDLPPDSFIYLSLGLIRPYKGLEELLPAFGALDDPAARLLVAGQSRPYDYATRLASQSAIAGDPRIRWHPHFVPDDDLQVWLNAADVAVLPYRRITTSGAALLAWSFGKPVIAPALPVFVELMAGHPFLGLLYDPDRPAALGEALVRAREIDWPARRPEILAWVGQFDWRSIAEQLAALYGRTMKGE